MAQFKKYRCQECEHLYDEELRTQDVWGAEGISGRVKFLLLAWAGMPKTSFRKNSDSPQIL
jgi:rubredoxin